MWIKGVVGGLHDGRGVYSLSCSEFSDSESRKNQHDEGGAKGGRRES
jgi:hypothetical protein